MTQVLGKSEDEMNKLYECDALGKWADVLGRRLPSDWDRQAGPIMSSERVLDGCRQRIGNE